jgi:hypothetical protein
MDTDNYYYSRFSTVTTERYTAMDAVQIVTLVPFGAD